MTKGRLRNMLILTAVLAMLAGHIVPMFADQTEGSERENAGRVLALQEVQRIQDDQGDYFFKSPHDIQIAPDGSLFVIDGDQFLKFGADGRFIKNLYKKGQGPGEFEGISGFIITDEALVVLQRQPDKLVIMSHEGEFIREFRPETSTTKLFAVYDGRYVSARNEIPKFEKVGKEPKILDVRWILGYISDNRSVEEPEMQFSTRWYAKRLGERAMIADHIANFIAKPYKDRYLVICHAEKYRLKLFNLDRKQTEREFGREYRRIRHQQQDKSGRIEIRPGVFQLAPPVEHLNDVQQVFIRGDDIWIMTSTIAPGKGILIDVFNKQGEFVDHFYLPIHQSVKAEGLEGLPVTFQGDYLYIVEYDEEDIPSIVKYRMAPQK